MDAQAQTRSSRFVPAPLPRAYQANSPNYWTQLQKRIQPIARRDKRHQPEDGVNFGKVRWPSSHFVI